MKAIEYLRAKARARKPATGGIVRIGDAPPIVDLPTGYLMPAPAPAPTQPAAVIEINLRKPTEAERALMLQQFRNALGTARTPSHRKDCGCWPRYSYCNCKP